VKRRGIIALVVQKSFDESDGTYGYRRAHADLVAWGLPTGPELVRSVMRELGLAPCQPRPSRRVIDEMKRRSLPPYPPQAELDTREPRASGFAPGGSTPLSLTALLASCDVDQAGRCAR
jgi:hypothetical protein